MQNKDIFFFKKYIDTVHSAYNTLDLKKLSYISSIIKKKIKQKKNIFVCGNGGSASIANHFLCDFNKGIKISSKNSIFPKVISLSNSAEIITAIANDIDFKKVFSSQFENYASSSDLLIIFSCSGKSKNILDLELYAARKRITVIKFYGFAQNLKKKRSNEIIINLKVNNYGISEDIFQGLMHMISQNIRSNFIKDFDFNKVRL
jgi:D-sedoheptulose 7-phosphate isomerase